MGTQCQASWQLSGQRTGGALGAHDDEHEGHDKELGAVVQAERPADAHRAEGHQERDQACACACFSNITDVCMQRSGEESHWGPAYGLAACHCAHTTSLACLGDAILPGTLHTPLLRR